MAGCEMGSSRSCKGEADFTIETEQGTRVDVCEQCILNYTGDAEYEVVA